MDFTEYLEFIPKKEDVKSFTSRSGLIDRTGHFYHVTQQLYNKTLGLSSNAANYRDHLFKSLCTDYKILPICNVIMPTHTHDVLLCENFADIQSVFHIVNVNFAKFIRKENTSRNRPNQRKIFSNSPSYERISKVEHLFQIFKYLYDNPQNLKDNGEFVPYSCFTSWQKKYYKPYNEKFYKRFFGMSLNDIVVLCQEKSKEEFFSIAHSNFGNKNEI